MSCPSCLSSNQAEFPAEVNIHFLSAKNLNHPGVLVYPKISICLDCGASRFRIPENELRLLGEGIAPSVAA
jgi:hypothetical protein